MTDNLNVNGTVRGKMSKLAKWAWGIATSAIGLAFIAGIIFWGGFNTVLEATNTETFCISCHEMEKNVYVEYRNTIHYQNRTGVRATCPDCHVPKQWFPKIIRKIQASNELLHKALGSIDTPEKFNAKRLELAQHEWDRMKKNDSQECRNCHTFTSMDYAEQNRRAATLHQIAFNQGHTCIDCHKGIAHTLPPIEQHIGAPKPDSAEMPSDKPLNPPVAVPPPAAPAAATTPPAPAAATTPPAPAAATTPAAPATPPPAGK